MKKVLFIFIVFLWLLIPLAKGQVMVKWDELPKTWYINSAAYPAEEPALDSLYYKLHDFILFLDKDGKYTMTISKDKTEKGIYQIDKKKRELLLTPDKGGQTLAFSVAELTPDILTLTINTKYSWMYYISLTSHQ